MPAPAPYLHLAGDARAALEFYAAVFGGGTTVHTFGDFGRTDGDADLVAHGELHGPVELFASDAGQGEPTLRLQGVLLALLGVAEPEVLQRWFAALGEGGAVVDPLESRAWGATDGQVRDRFGVTWLIGYEPSA